MEPLESVYEVGCGSGANLYLFADEGVKVGGIDYSQTLISVAKDILCAGDGLTWGDAADLPVEQMYDSVFSNAVFSYFSDWEYAESVLEKMLQITKRSIGLMDIHNESKKQDFLEYRRKTISDYDERYKNFEKLFLGKKCLFSLQTSIIWILNFQ